MKNNKTLLIIAAICLLVLAVLSTTFSVINRLGLLRMGLPVNSDRLTSLGQGFMNQDDSGSGITIPDDLQQGQGGDTQGDSTIPPDGNTPQFINPSSGDFNGVRPDRGAFPGSGFRGGMTRSGSLLGWIGTVLYGIGLIIAILAAIGILKVKKWGVILGIIVAVVLGVAGAFGLFPFIGWLTLVIAIVKVMLAIAVITLLMVKPSRELWNVKKDDLDDEDVEYDEDEGSDLVTERILATEPEIGLPEGQLADHIIENDDEYDEEAEEKDL